MFLWFLLLCSMIPAAAEPASTDPSDVFVRVAVVRDALEQIRFEMGRPLSTHPEIPVYDVAPREVFFQALTLFHKADRFCFEQTRERTPAPDIPEGTISPADVADVVNAANARIERVRSKIGTDEPISPPSRDGSRTPTDVFRSIVQANRQLNLLLDQRVSPSDVFQQVTFSVSYAARLLATFPGAERIPDAPSYERGKKPADVYRRLTGCFDRVRAIAGRSGLKTLELRMPDESLDSITPSDVYDIASLLLSELLFIHSHVEAAEPPNQVYYPGIKYPSHVYQRAGILERQLEELEKRVSSDPDWMRKRPNE